MDECNYGFKCRNYFWGRLVSKKPTLWSVVYSSSLEVAYQEYVIYGRQITFILLLYAIGKPMQTFNSSYLNTYSNYEGQNCNLVTGEIALITGLYWSLLQRFIFAHIYVNQVLIYIQIHQYYVSSCTLYLLPLWDLNAIFIYSCKDQRLFSILWYKSIYMLHKQWKFSTAILKYLILLIHFYIAQFIIFSRSLL